MAQSREIQIRINLKPDGSSHYIYKGDDGTEKKFEISQAEATRMVADANRAVIQNDREEAAVIQNDREEAAVIQNANNLVREINDLNVIIEEGPRNPLLNAISNVIANTVKYFNLPLMIFGGNKTKRNRKKNHKRGKSLKNKNRYSRY